MQYASIIMEFYREKRGLSPTDTSQDEQIIEDLAKGEKLSKSKHMIKEYKLND